MSLFCFATWVQTQNQIRRYPTFTVEFFGGVFGGSRDVTHYLVRPDEPIPLKLLRKTRVKPQLLKHHPITEEPLNTHGQIPFGFVRVNGALRPDVMEQFVLQRIKEMRKNGVNLSKIARYLVDSGIPAKNGGRWQANTVNKILSRI